MHLPSPVASQRSKPAASSTLPWPGTERLRYPRAASPVFDAATDARGQKARAPDHAFDPPPVADSARERFTQLVKTFQADRCTHADFTRDALPLMESCATDPVAKAAFRAVLQDTCDPDTGRAIRLNRRLVNAAIAICAQAGKAEMAIAWFHDLVTDGLRPDAGTCTSVLYACSNGGRPDLAIDFLDDMIKLGLRPGIADFNTTLDNCVKAGEFDKAAQLFEYLLVHRKALGILPDSNTCQALLAACNASGRPEDAARLLLLHLPPYSSLWRAVIGSAAYHTMLVNCTPGMASDLLARGIATGVYRPELGYSSRRNLLDLRQSALLTKPAAASHGTAVHPALANAVFHELAVKRRRVDPHTSYLTGEDAPQALLATIDRCRSERGWNGPLRQGRPPYAHVAFAPGRTSRR